jgi:hypothetical protein
MSRTSGVFNSPPPHLERMLMRRYGTSTHGLLFNKNMKYSEVTIEEEDLLVALGRARDRGRGRLTLTGSPEAALLVSDEHPRDLTSKYALARTGYTIGACASLLGLLLLLILCTVWGIHEANEEGKRGAFVNNPPVNQPFNPPQLQPPGGGPGGGEVAGRGFMEQALDDLRNPNVFTRRAAASRLVNGPDDPRQRADFQAALADGERRKEVARLLVDLLKDDPLARDSAAAALKRWIVGDVVPDVIAVMEQDARGGTRALVEVLGASKDVRAVPALVKLLKDPFLRPTASQAIESIGPDATPALVKALEDKPRDRVLICGLLGKVGTAEALPALEKLQESEDRQVALAAKIAQVRITERANKQ